MIGDTIWTHDRVYIQVNDAGTLEVAYINRLPFLKKLELYLSNYFKPMTPVEFNNFISYGKRSIK